MMRSQTKPIVQTSPTFGRFAALLSLTTVLLLSTLRSDAQLLEILALEGDGTSEGPIVSVEEPVSASGDSVLFLAEVDIGSNDPHAFILVENGERSILFREPFAIPAEGIELTDLWTGNQTPPILTSDGDIIFMSDFRPLGGGSIDEGVFLYDGATGTVASVVLDGDPVPNGNGDMFVQISNHPASAPNDRIAFFAEISNAVGGFGNGSGLFRSSGADGVVRIVRTGQIPPAGGGDFFDGFSWPSVNASGEVSFLGLPNSGPEGIYKGSGGALTTIALESDQLFPGWVVRGFTPVHGLAINDDGNVAFRADIEDPLIDAIFLGDGTFVERIAYGGQTPDQGPPGTVSFSFDRNIALNNNNQVAFSGTGGPAGTGIFRAESGLVVAIARRDSPVPGTVSGTFIDLSGNELALNDSGDVVFEASFQNGGETSRGIFFYGDGVGLQPPVVQLGTQIAGSTVTSYELVGVEPFQWRAGEPTALGEDGAVVFKFRLANGVNGIARYRSGILFADGFESGNTSAWDAAP